MNRSDRSPQEPPRYRTEGDDRNRTGAAFRSLVTVAFVPLRGVRGTARAFALVDPEDEARVAPHRWWLHDHRAHVRGRVDGERVWLHQFILGGPIPAGHVVDHINGWPLDNRRENLRIITRAQNAENQIGREGYSQHRGVTFDKSRGLWMATARGKTLGRFRTEAEAAEVAANWRAVNMPYSAEAAA